MTSYRDLFFKSHDGLTLYARDYAGPESAPVVICIPGLTRNSADFEELCEALCAHYRLIAVDLRGRGRSDADHNPLNYHPGTYSQDMACLLEAESLASAMFIGTSLGGLVAMTLAATNPESVRGIVLNDVGPEIDPKGLARIRNYVSNHCDVENWEQAVAATKKVQQEVLPGLNDSQWQAFTRRLYRENSEGKPILNYDPKISVLMESQDGDAPPPDLWTLFSSLSHLPMMVIRGKSSDLLSAEVVEKMVEMHSGLEALEVAGRGHAPLLNEPGVVPTIQAFLERVSST